jgi:hypothetical protein
MIPDDKMTDKELRGRLEDIHRRITGLEDGLFGILAFLMLVTMFFVKFYSR